MEIISKEMWEVVNHACFHFVIAHASGFDNLGFYRQDIIQDICHVDYGSIHNRGLHCGIMLKIYMYITFVGGPMFMASVLLGGKYLNCIDFSKYRYILCAL